MEQYTGYFGGQFAKNHKNYGILKFFLTQDHMQIQSAISPTIFIGAHPNFMRTFRLPYGKSKCLFEYCNQKLPSNT